MDSYIPYCILVVEDDDTIWELGIKKLLASLFPTSRLIRARNRAETYFALIEKPDLITMDGTLADGSSGLQLVKEFPSLGIKAPVVMLSANRMPPDVVKDAGAQAYCFKMDMRKELPTIFKQLGFAVVEEPGRSH